MCFSCCCGEVSPDPIANRLVVPAAPVVVQQSREDDIDLGYCGIPQSRLSFFNPFYYFTRRPQPLPTVSLGARVGLANPVVVNRGGNERFVSPPRVPVQMAPVAGRQIPGTGTATVVPPRRDLYTPVAQPGRIVPGTGTTTVVPPRRPDIRGLHHHVPPPPRAPAAPVRRDVQPIATHRPASSAPTAHASTRPVPGNGRVAPGRR